MVTITQIKSAVKKKKPNFFTNKTLRFFGQNLQRFKVYTCADFNWLYPNQAVIIAPVYSQLGDFMGYLTKKFTGDDLIDITTYQQAQVINKYKESN